MLEIIKRFSDKNGELDHPLITAQIFSENIPLDPKITASFPEILSTIIYNQKTKRFFFLLDQNSLFSNQEENATFFKANNIDLSVKNNNDGTIWIKMPENSSLSFINSENNLMIFNHSYDEPHYRLSPSFERLPL
jgi:hypothetical protein